MENVQDFTPPPVVKRCKHCRQEIIGGHDERRAHTQNCGERRKHLAEKRTVVTSGTPDPKVSHTPGSHNDHYEPQNSSNNTQEGGEQQAPKTTKKIVLKGQDTCIVCGKVFFNGSHDVEACKREKGGSLYCPGRRRTKDEVQMQIQKRKDLGLDPNPYKFAKSVTPDISAYDKKIKSLVNKKLPPIPAKSPTQQWVFCSDCGKRLILAHLQEHRDNVCVVAGIQSKFDKLLSVVAEGLGIEEEIEEHREAQDEQGEAEEQSCVGQEGSAEAATTNDDQAPEPSGAVQSGSVESDRKGTSENRTISKVGDKKSAGTGGAQQKKHHQHHRANRILSALAEADAITEEAQHLVAVVDSVVPVTDLFLETVNVLSPVLEPSLAEIAAALPTIESRLGAWKESVRTNNNSGAVGGATEFTPNTTAGSTASASLLSSGGVGQQQRGMMPKLSGLLHGPKLHLRKEDERRIIPKPGKRTLELAQSKTAKQMGGASTSNSSGNRRSNNDRGLRSEGPTVGDDPSEDDEREGTQLTNNNSSSTSASDDVLLHSKFNPEVIRLAQAIVGGQMTMSEALYPELHPTKERRIYGKKN